MHKVSVSERMYGSYIPHEITDYVFDDIMGEKEIYNIDDVKYEKVRHVVIHDVQTFDFSKSFQDMQSIWSISFCINTYEHYYGGEGIWCVPFFQTNTPDISLGEDNTWTTKWTVVRES